jgi:hypothetical protein
MNTSSALGVTVLGEYAYVADSISGLRIFDVATPASPTEVGLVGGIGDAWDVEVSRGFAYVAAGAGVQVIDVSTPGSPSAVGSCNTGNTSWDVALSGPFAYVADRDNGLVVCDISMPASPFVEGSFDLSGDTIGVATDGVNAYVAATWDGLQVFRGCSVFVNGFESGDTSAWSRSVP